MSNIFEGGVKNMLQTHIDKVIDSFDEEELIKLNYQNNNDKKYIDEKFDELDIPNNPKLREEVWDFAKDQISEGFSYSVYTSLNESYDIIKLLESEASKEAKELGLYHKGFGNYTDEKGGSTIYKTINGKLTPFGKMAKRKKKEKEEDEPKKSKKPKKIEVKPSEIKFKSKDEEESSKKKKKKIKGISSIHRSKGDKYTFYFEYNGNPSSITLTEKEYRSGKPISKIIAYKIKHRQEMKSKGKKTPEMKKKERKEREAMFKPSTIKTRKK